MLRIRLRRVGAKKQPSYRIVVAESTSPRDGKFVEVIGFYNPRTEPETVTIKEERALHWLSMGAQPSDPVVRLLKNNGTYERLERFQAGESIEDLVAEAQVEKAVDVEDLEETVSEPQPEEVSAEESEGDVVLSEDTMEDETAAPSEEDEVGEEETNE